MQQSRRELYGQSSDRARLLVEQLEFQLEELEGDQAQCEAAADIAAPAATPARRRPARRPLPEGLPRERVVHPAPCACARCGGTDLRKLGEDMLETLECEPRRWKVVQHVREKFSCRACEAISQAPAPSHPVSRGRAGPNLLAMVLAGKYGQHLPLHRQSAAYAREGVELDVSTLADWVGAAAATLGPLTDAVRRHVLAAGRLHGDDTTVPVLAKGKAAVARLWVYVRDDRPSGGSDPPAAMYFYSRTRAAEHPARHLAGWSGILQADAGACPRAGLWPDPGAGYDGLYDGARRPGPVLEAACWAHVRRKLFDEAKDGKSPIAAQAVRRVDALFAVERAVNGQPPGARLAAGQERSAPLLAELQAWLRQQRGRLSGKADLAKAIDYALKRWGALTLFLRDGRACMSNNAAERALRGVAVGRRNWTFCGSDAGGERAAAIYTLIETCKLNDVDPQAWLADVLAKLPDHPASRLGDLLSRDWLRAARGPA